jgi:alkyl hydroperoxide reductase subunit AhpC
MTQSMPRSISLMLGDTAPDFEAATTRGPIRFHDWLGSSWGVLFSHPRDFTPVCTTEVSAFAHAKREFDRRDVKLIGLSGDTLQSHEQWARDIRESQGIAVNFPIIADLDRRVAGLYGMLHAQHDEMHTVRTLFIIDPSKKLRLTLAYPQTCGRNVEEILRVVDSLQLTDRHAVSTPANWHSGDDVIISPALSDAEAVPRFAFGWSSPLPYLRLAAIPQ